MVQDCSKMKAIGGYFGLELDNNTSTHPFPRCIAVNSGRHALEYILINTHPKPSKIYLPYYTCEVVLEPIKRMGLEYEFYYLNNNFEIKCYPKLKDNEYIIVNNYFGIKDKYIEKVFSIYHEHLIVDCAQALFSPIIEGVKMFLSPRKFIGVADGGYAFPNYESKVKLEQDQSTDRSIHLLRRIDTGAESGFKEFQKDDETLSNESLKGMSNLTKSILKTTNIAKIIERRRLNYMILHNALSFQNGLKLPDINEFRCPMIYPFWSEDKALRKKLISNKIFVATYWSNVLEWCNRNSIEYQLADKLIPLPIDQRYGIEDMNRIIHVIRKL